MLIIGDITSLSHGNNLHIDTLEIVHFTSKERLEIIDKYRLKDPTYNKLSVEYYEPTGLINYNVKLYNGNNCFPFKNILFNHSANKKKGIMYNDIVSNFSLYTSKIKYRNENVLEWEKNVIKYNFYRGKEHLLFNDDLHSYKTLYKSLVYYNIIQEKVLPNYKKYSTDNRTKYTEKSLINLFSRDGISIYEYINLFLTERLEPMDWKTLSEVDKIEAVLEKIYSDTILEYISKDPSIKSDDAILYFKTSIMNLCTNIDFPEWFKEFIIHNYSKIVSKYKVSFLNAYETGVKHDLLTIN